LRRAERVLLLAFIVAMSTLGSAGAQSTLARRPPPGYWAQISGERQSPSVADPTWGDTKRSFVGADGRPITIVVQSPRVRELALAQPVNGAMSDDAYLARLITDAVETNRKSRRGRRIQFEKRTYQLNEPIQITGANDLDLDFAGATLMFRNLRYTTNGTAAEGTGAQSGIIITNGSRVRLRNVTITHEVSTTRRPWSVGSAVQTGAGVAIKLDVPTGTSLPMQAVSTFADINIPWQWNDPENYREVNALNETIGPDGWSNPSPDFDAFVGRRVIVRHTVYGDPAIHVQSTNDVSVENTTITNSPGMGILVTQGRGILVRNTRIERASAQPISGSADGLHIAATAGDVIVDHNEFSFQADDALNIHAKLIPVVGSADGHQLRRRSQGEIADWAFRESQPGQHALLYASNMQYLDKATIVANSGDSLRFADPLPAGVSWVVLQERIPRRVSITNNRFHDNRGRGILFLGANAEIANNFVARVPSVGVLGLVDAVKFGEGPGVVNTIISGNEFSQFSGRSTRHFMFDGAVVVGHTLAVDLALAQTLHSNVHIFGNRFVDVIGPGDGRPAFIQIGPSVDLLPSPSHIRPKRKAQ
jgi:Right handed beta helix region